jgi:hypothetical protein
MRRTYSAGSVTSARQAAIVSCGVRAGGAVRSHPRTGAHIARVSLIEARLSIATSAWETPMRSQKCALLIGW